MLVIPCGHSLCEICAVTDVCSVSHTTVKSRILNIMLHTVISNHHRLGGTKTNDDDGYNNTREQSESYRHPKYTDRKYICVQVFYCKFAT